MTDEASHYKDLASEFPMHKTVSRSKEEYVNKFHAAWRINTIESYFSVFKRGI